MDHNLREILREVARTNLECIQAGNRLVAYLSEMDSKSVKELVKEDWAEHQLADFEKECLIDVVKTSQGERPSKSIKEVPDVLIYPYEMMVEYKGKNVRFTISEYRMFELLFRRPRVVRNRDELMDAIARYGNEYNVDDRTMDSHVKRMRRKLRKIDKNCPYIVTVWGAGYCLIR